MPLFKCKKCGTIENTALSLCSWINLRGDMLCSECCPQQKKWHNKFPKKKFNKKKYKIVDGFVYLK